LDDSIEAKAAALLDAIQIERGFEPYEYFQRGYTHNEALCRAIEQHEAFKQEVSDVMTYIKALYPTLPRNFDRFIIPKPKPDPLVEVIKAMQAEPTTYVTSEVYANRIHKKLDALGFEIREKTNDPKTIPAG
jgi:hypothetical protein